MNTLIIRYVAIIISGVFFFYLIDKNNIDATAIIKDKEEKGEGYRRDKVKREILKLDEKTNHLVWFLQISDLHLSAFRDPTRTSQLLNFVKYTINIINPAVVLASGDLTDAKKNILFDSKQHIYEWLMYNSILHSTGILNKTVWLDMRGNHDCYNVANDKGNLYQKYSIQGHFNNGSYIYVHKYGVDSIAFIAVDACPSPGPKWPFNFIGIITDSEMDRLKRLEANSGNNNNYTIWFGHYPTSCILSPKPGIRNLMGKKGLAYMCGHLHTFGGLIPNMYTRHPTGSLELELGDWKNNRIFRVAAVDHGFLSFTDVKYNTWPIILITNPKNALFSMIDREPLHLLRKSSHIRVLIWSPSPIIQAQVRVGESKLWTQLRHRGGPLYVSDWNPSYFMKGLHSLSVYARDTNGRRATISIKFSLDRSFITSLSNFGFGSRALLSPNVTFIAQLLFGITVLICVIPLCIFRIYDRNKCNLFKKLWILVNIDRLFWSFIIYSALLVVCPWFVGNIIDDHIGCIFAWGTFVNKTFIPGSLTYGYGFTHLILFQIPLIFIIAHLADFRFQCLYKKPKHRFLNYIFPRMCLIILIIIQLTAAYIFYFSYGFMVIFFGSLPIRSIIFELALWYQATNLPRNFFVKFI